MQAELTGKLNFCNDTFCRWMIDELRIQKNSTKYLKAKCILQKVKDIQVPHIWSFEVNNKFMIVKRVQLNGIDRSHYLHSQPNYLSVVNSHNGHCIM